MLRSCGTTALEHHSFHAPFLRNDRAWAPFLPRSVPTERPRSGTGRGLTVRQIIDEVERVTGGKVPHVMKPRRPGDPPELYAHVGLAEKELGFRARRSDIEAIVSSAWPYFRDRR